LVCLDTPDKRDLESHIFSAVPEKQEKLKELLMHHGFREKKHDVADVILMRRPSSGQKRKH